MTPFILFVGHLLYGAEHALAAQWYVFVAAVVATSTLVLPAVNRSLVRVRLLIPAVLLTLVLLVAALSLTSWGPEGPHRLWSLVPGAGAGHGTLNLTTTLFEMIKLAGLACLFLLGCAHGARRAWARTTMAGLLWLATAYAVVSLGMFLTGAQVMEGERLSGGFLSANSGALVFGVLAILALSAALEFWQERRWARCVIAVSQSILFAICLVMTASRAGMAATVAGGLVLMIWEIWVRRDIGAALILAGLSFALGISAVLISGNDLLWRRADDYAGDLLVRTTIFHDHWRAFLERPLTGYGLGSFTEINNLVMIPDNYGSLEPIRAAHNVYIQWLEEAGVIGAAPMFALIGWILWATARRGTSRRPEAFILRGVFAASIAVLALGTTDFGLQIISIAGFWAFLLGLAYALSQSSKSGSAGKGRTRRDRPTSARAATATPGLTAP